MILPDLGIPGDDVTAAHGRVPSRASPRPNIFFENTTVVYGIFGLPYYVRHPVSTSSPSPFQGMVRITQLPEAHHLPPPTIFAFVGTYPSTRARSDILCLILFGIPERWMCWFQFRLPGQ